MSQHPVGYLTRFKSQVDDAEQFFPGESHDHLWSYTHGTKKMEHFAAFQDMEVMPLYAAPQATPPAQSAPPAAADAPVCPWCDREGWDTCQHAEEAKTCHQ